MSGSIPFIPPMPNIMPQRGFEALISREGLRVTWARSHTCPCVFGGGGPNGRLPTPGSPDPACNQCSGIGIYWDAPSTPFKANISFAHMSPSPDEPGTRMNQDFGPVQLSEPMISIPYNDPATNTINEAWANAGTDDMFSAIDSLARFTANLQVGGIEGLPYQENIRIAPSGAVTVYDPVSHDVTPVPSGSYTVSGTGVILSGYPVGTNYMVEFYSAPLYIAWRSAGGIPHVRPLGGGGFYYPRRMRLQALDFWTRERNINTAQVYRAINPGAPFPISPA